MVLPNYPVTLPPATRYANGLYDAATLVPDETARHLGGVLLTDPNAGGHGRWPVDTEGDTPDPKAGDRPEDEEFPATIVWAADENKAVGWSEDNAVARAEHVLSIVEHVEVERHAAETLATYASKPFTDWVGAVGHLDAAIASSGHMGVLHAPRHLLARLQDKGMIVRQSGKLLTPGGNTWAFGAGYEQLGNTVVATGTVVVRQSPVNTVPSFDHKTNTRMTVAERIVTPYWGNPVAAATITTGGGGGSTIPGGDTVPSEELTPGAAN